MTKLRVILFIFLWVGICSAMNADHLSTATKTALHQHKSRNPTSWGNDEKISCFVEADGTVAATLRSKGLRLTPISPNLYTAQIPIAMMEAATGCGAERIAVAKKVQICNDSALYFSNWAPALAPEYYSNCDGSGVIVGMIDTGFDLHHIHFKAPDGSSRISAVYLPADTTGTSPVVATDTLPGSVYYAEAINALTTDCNSLHGTHTMGTAAGSFAGNPYAGVAKGAELVVCGMDANDLTDVNIANSLKFVFHYAQACGKPCVVNMSLSSYAEAHDGSSQLCKVFDELSGNGKIIVVSSGNDGNKDVCLHKDLLQPTDTLSTFLANQWYGYNLNGHLSMWSATDAPFSMRLQVVDRTNRALLYQSPWLSALPSDSIYEVSSHTDSAFAQYYEGEWLFASAVENNGKFHADFLIDAKYRNANHSICLQFTSATPVSLRGWGSSNMRFPDYGFEGHTRGDASMSISDLATSSSVISVGAYCSRRNPAVVSGVNNEVVKGSVPGIIASYSSYGADMRGIIHPDVVAPGTGVVSSYSRFDQTMAVSNNWLTCVENVDGIAYPYGINTGTSMSAPVVTGAIALALQLNPCLTPQEVKTLLRHTSYRDSFVESDPIRWGAGKLNIAALLAQVENAQSPFDFNHDGLVNVSDVSTFVDILIQGKSAPGTDLNADGETNVSDLSTLVNAILLR